MKHLSSEYKQMIQNAADKSLRTVMAKLKSLVGERTGCYIRVFYCHDRSKGINGGWPQLFKAQVGELTEETLDAKQRVSDYKAGGLMVLHMIDDSFISSAQYAQDKTQDYPGAFIIIANVPDLGEVKLLVCCSGFPPEVDETLNLLICKEMGWGDEGQWETITDHSKNEVAPQLLAA